MHKYDPGSTSAVLLFFCSVKCTVVDIFLFMHQLSCLLSPSIAPRPSVDLLPDLLRAVPQLLPPARGAPPGGEQGELVLQAMQVLPRLRAQKQEHQGALLIHVHVRCLVVKFNKKVFVLLWLFHFLVKDDFL